VGWGNSAKKREAHRPCLPGGKVPGNLKNREAIKRTTHAERLAVLLNAKRGYLEKEAHRTRKIEDA